MALVLLLCPFSPSGRVAQALMNLCHAPLFAVLAATCSWAFRGLRGGGVWSGLLPFVFALSTEGLQHLVGRQASLRDLLANLLGILAGLLWMATPKRPLAAWAFRIIAIGLLIVGMASPVWTLADSIWQVMQLPVISSFESRLELSRWTAQNSQLQRVREHATEGFWSLRVDLDTAPFPGIALPEVPPDWTAYDALALDVMLESPERLALIVKITDQAHNWDYDDRFHLQVNVSPGLNSIRIPLRDIEHLPNGRRMDLRRMRMLQLFAIKPKAPARFYLDHIRLMSH